MDKTSTGQYHNNYVELIVKASQKFSVSGSFFSEKQLLNLYTMILVFFFLHLDVLTIEQIICLFLLVSHIHSH